MTQNEFLKLCNTSIQKVKNRSPIDTRNMRYNAIRGHMEGFGEYVISMSLDIAPYFWYTTKPWVSAYWNGKKNPNEGWWDDAIEQVVKLVANAVNGVVEK